ncbi:MAG: papain-like cysteine protease family protein [Candidatus Obscuribacterales bacterium]
MPGIEQQNLGDRAHQSSGRTGSGIRSIHLDAWGPKASHSQKTRQTSATDEFGHVTISNSVASDSLREWCAKPFGGFQPPDGLGDAEKKLAHSSGSVSDHVLALEVGTVKAVYSVGNGLAGFGNAIVSPPARVGNWLANTIKNPDLAIEDSAKFGDDVGKAVVNDAKFLHAVGAYAKTVQDAQARGDYSKPLTDVGNAAHKEYEKFEKLTPGQKTSVATEQVVCVGIGIATGKVLSAASEAFAGLLEKMDAFKLKADANRLHFGIESAAKKPLLSEEIQSNDVSKRAGEVHHADGEKHFAGATNGRFKYEEIEKFRSPEVPIQCHKNACVAAAGEMLTKGKIDQQSLVQRLEQYLLPELRGKESLLALQDLAVELGKDWQFKTVSKRLGIDFEPLFEELLTTKQPFAVTLKAFQVDAHAVVVDGVNAAGRVVIRDPGDGTIYQMTMNDFMDHWTGQAVARR